MSTADKKNRDCSPQLSVCGEQLLCVDRAETKMGLGLRQAEVGNLSVKGLEI